MPPPVVALDVDGVLCPLPDWDRMPDGWRPPDGDDFGDWVEIPAGFGAPVSRALADRVACWPARRVWVTSWGASANGPLADALGWAPLPVAPDPANDTDGWVKAAQVRQLLDARPSALVWVDDDLDRHPDDVDAVVAAARDAGVPLLCVRPDRHRGLTVALVDQVHRWLDRPDRHRRTLRG